MMKTLLAAVAALALLAARPASACDGDCKNCPHHAQAAADGKKGDKAEAPHCACAKDGKACKCGEKCQCPHCAAHRGAEKQPEPKKS